MMSTINDILYKFYFYDIMSKGDSMDNLDQKLFEEFEIKNELVQAEKNLTDYTIDNLTLELNSRKLELVTKIDNFISTNMYLDDNNKMKMNIKGSPSLVISEYFFKPVVPMIGIEPKYNAEKMSLVFDIYRETVSEINIKIGKFVPNKSHFCRFAGITSQTYNNYMKSNDENLQNVMIMIDDYMLDANLTSSQNREIDSITTIYRTKVEQNKQEQPTQQTVVLADTVDINLIQSRIKKLNSIKEAKVIENEPEKIINRTNS